MQSLNPSDFPLFGCQQSHKCGFARRTLQRKCRIFLESSKDEEENVKGENRGMSLKGIVLVKGERKHVRPKILQTVSSRLSGKGVLKVR